MSGPSAIEWTDATWNPVRGCSRVSEGCRNCYAERHAARFSDEGVEMNDVDGHMHGALPFAGFAKNTPAGPRWTGEVALIPSALDWPLRKKKPLRIFVNSMSDLFHEKLPADDILRVFLVMARCPQHTFQILTKRPERMQRLVGEWLKPAMTLASGASLSAPIWPLPNVWLGVSVENQATADERIPLLLQTPAAKRFVSYEPALGPVDLERWVWPTCQQPTKADHDRECGGGFFCEERSLDWVIVGGESGPGARPFDIAWARSTVEQCRSAGVACFVKQMGARPLFRYPDGSNDPGQPYGAAVTNADGWPRFRDRKGGDWSEWPEDLRVREFPA